jgi:uncharacterized protein (DUF433 family)
MGTLASTDRRAQDARVVAENRESSMNWKDHIATDPNVLLGKPIIRGTRISVELILDRLADGWTQEDLHRAYPNLTQQAIQAVFAFASEMMRDEEYVALEKLSA